MEPEYLQFFRPFSTLEPQGIGSPGPQGVGSPGPLAINKSPKNSTIPRPPNVPLFRALWALLGGIWGVLYGCSEVLVVPIPNTVNDKHPAEHKRSYTTITPGHARFLSSTAQKPQKYNPAQFLLGIFLWCRI